MSEHADRARVAAAGRELFRQLGTKPTHESWAFFLRCFPAAPLPAPTAHARYALWLEHHARTATSPARAAEEARATCRALYPHQARLTGKETPL